MENETVWVLVDRASEDRAIVSLHKTEESARKKRNNYQLPGQFDVEEWDIEP